MKKILLIFLLFLISTILFCGCSSNKPFILMKSQPVTADNAKYFEQNFKKGQRVYYAIVKPNGFNDDAIKIEIVKKNTSTPTLGYSMEYAQNLSIDKTKKYYTNYFVPNNSGLFFMQVFELRRPDKCIARYDFWVK